jgi:hypothetical protein
MDIEERVPASSTFRSNPFNDVASESVAHSAQRRAACLIRWLDIEERASASSTFHNKPFKDAASESLAHSAQQRAACLIR